MLSQIKVLVKNHLRAIVRDRVLHAVLGVALVMILLVPSMSSFSMRQVQELAITLSLSAVSLVLLVVSLLLGASSIWRDIEKRYTTSILTLPLSRAAYLLSKFFSVALFLLLSTLVLGVGVAAVILLSAATYPSDLPIHWANISLALGADVVKYILLTAFALLLSSVSTSFYLPFFGTLAIYLCGSASQEVYEYTSSQFGQGMHPLMSQAANVAYYILPNFSAFDFQIHAVYGLPIAWGGVLLSVGYASVYTGLLLGMAIFAFNRRQLP